MLGADSPGVALRVARAVMVVPSLCPAQSTDSVTTQPTEPTGHAFFKGFCVAPATDENRTKQRKTWPAGREDGVNGQKCIWSGTPELLDLLTGLSSS